MTVAILLIQLVLAPSQVVSRPAQPLLDVPFVAQTPELCGGAAVSMVMRYWGQRDVFPQDFAALVSQSDGGIFTGVLAKSVSDRGWVALIGPAARETGRARIGAEIDRGRPIIALIEVAPRTYHYVVIVAATDNEVVFHDPARGPFRVMDWLKFELAWSAANNWMMVALPPAGFVATALPESPSVTTAGTAATPAMPCTALVNHAVQSALAGEVAAAEQELAAAMRLCPADAAAWREMAGLRFSQKRWSDADELATIAVRKGPGDAYAWQLAATSRYLMGDPLGALAAWNQIGEPRIDAVNIHGAERTPLPVIARAADLAPRTLLTRGTFSRSLRRLRDVPVASTASMKFEPVAGGLARIDIVVVEKPAWPTGRTAWLMFAARPAIQRELRLDIAGLSGIGESAFVSWRFASNRQKVGTGLAFPSPRGLPGVTTFSAMWEDQTYAPTGSAGERRQESRRRAGLELSDWAAGGFKWKAGAAFDRFNDAEHFALDASLVARPASDRAALILSTSAWMPLGEPRTFSTGGIRAVLRSTSDRSRPVLSAVAEFQRASSASPLAVWPSAGSGTGTERAAVLRGHRLVDNGIVTGNVFGRRLVNGSVEYSHPVRDIRTMTLFLAGFLDAAKASLRRDNLPATPVLVDAGAGLRLHLPGGLGGLRLDVAHRLGAGRTVVSAGWIAPWPQ